MQKRLALTLLVFSLTFPAFAKEGWGTDYKAALEQAAEKNKPVLLEFTGSDWCPPCKKLSADVFSKPEFQKFAQENLVLVELDFPNNKPQSDALKKQNQMLAQKFGVEGYPTVVLLNSKGKEVAREVGYQPGGPKAFIKWVESSLE
ncbi:MAG: thioredoxin family protein [Terrimicrobiaceae bacterium]|nr:thioredoxin family protein [Terrimicrobiaceae bacterium]